MALQGYLVPLHEPAEQPKNGRQLPSTEKFNKLFAKNPQWHDTGCEMHPACLECPEVDCIATVKANNRKHTSDHPIGTLMKPAWRARDERRARIVALRLQGVSTRRIAGMLGLSLRTINRVPIKSVV